MTAFETTSSIGIASMRTVPTYAFDIETKLRKPSLRKILNIAGSKRPKSGSDTKVTLVGRTLPWPKKIIRPIPIRTLGSPMIGLYEIPIAIAVVILLASSSTSRCQLAIPWIVMAYKLPSGMYQRIAIPMRGA